MTLGFIIRILLCIGFRYFKAFGAAVVLPHFSVSVFDIAAYFSIITEWACRKPLTHCGTDMSKSLRFGGKRRRFFDIFCGVFSGERVQLKTA